MNQTTKSKIYATKDGELLWALGYRLDGKGCWRLPIDGSLGLTQGEQRINDAGGMNFGSDTAAVVSQEISASLRLIDGFTDDEIALSPSLSHRADWLKRATS